MLEKGVIVVVPLHGNFIKGKGEGRGEEEEEARTRSLLPWALVLGVQRLLAPSAPWRQDTEARAGWGSSRPAFLDGSALERHVTRCVRTQDCGIPPPSTSSEDAQSLSQAKVQGSLLTSEGGGALESPVSLTAKLGARPQEQGPVAEQGGGACSSPQAATTKAHTLHGLPQHSGVFSAWEARSARHGAGRATCSRKVLGQTSSLPISSF